MSKTTALGLSIGTGLAFETYFNQDLYDLNRPIPPPLVPLKEFKGIFINVTTLLRNLIAGADEEAKDDHDLLDLCRGEIHILTTLLPQPPVFYHSRYSPLSNLPSTALRKPSTPKQLHQHRLMELTLKALKRYNRELQTLDWSLPAGIAKPNLIFTHVVADLYNLTKGNKSILLESNTGKTKDLTQFASKFYNVPNPIIPYIPFNPTIGSFLGDKVLIRPGPNGLRKQFFEEAYRQKWHSLTNIEKVFNGLKHKETAALLAYLKLLPKL